MQPLSGMRQMKQMVNSAMALLIVVFVCHVGAESTEDTLRSALEDEMERSLERLQLENEPMPYFIAYTVTEVRAVSATSTLGAQLNSNFSRSRILDVQVRVGSPELDNTNFAGSSGPFNLDFGGMMGGGPAFPITDSYDEIRRVAWLATDSAYKNAVSNLAAKKSALEQQNIEDRPNDFSEEEPFVYSSSNKYPVADTKFVSELATELSAAFSGMPDIHTSSATVNSVSTRRLYLDSQGSSHSFDMGVCSATTSARTQTSEGIGIRANSKAYARTCDELDDREALKAMVAEAASRLVSLSKAETLDSYSGPVLFEPQAAAQLISQALSVRFAATPKPISQSSGGFSFPSAPENPFLNRIDSRVLPRTMSVVNDPTTKEFNGRSLLGSYDVDSEGMPSRRTELISNGMLKALLNTRAPTKTSATSTGSNRGVGGPVPGNLFVESSEGVSMDELRSELLSLAEENGQEYAIVVRQILDPGDLDFADMTNPQLMSQIMSVMGGGVAILPTVETMKVYPDGTEVPVLPVSITEFVDSYYRDIVATSEERQSFDISISPAGNMMGMLGGMVGGGMGGIAATQQLFMSVVTPALLFEDLTLRSAAGSKLRAPLISHPSSD